MKLKKLIYNDKCIITCPFNDCKIGSISCGECKYKISSTNQYVDCGKVDELLIFIEQIKYETKSSGD